jgi:hypothetical protein
MRSPRGVARFRRPGGGRCGRQHAVAESFRYRMLAMLGRARVSLSPSLSFSILQGLPHTFASRARVPTLPTSPPRACRTLLGHDCDHSVESRAPLRSESHRIRDSYVVDAAKLADMEREFGGRDD